MNERTNDLLNELIQSALWDHHSITDRTVSYRHATHNSCITEVSLSTIDKGLSKFNSTYRVIVPLSSFIHSGYFYSASSNPLLLRGAPDTALILCRSFMPKRHRQLQVKDLPKVPS